MPIYEYQCNQCSHSFETLVLKSETPACPSCKSNDLSRLLSACGFVSKSSSPGEPAKTSASSGCGTCAASSCASCGIG